jgi:beta-lactamase regulating signal transducer with metallopeptidase domain
MQSFIDSLNGAAAVFVDRSWAVVWQSTLMTLIVAVGALLFLRRSSPSVRYWVWQILAVKILLMPCWTYALALPRAIPAGVVAPLVAATGTVSPEAGGETLTGIPRHEADPAAEKFRPVTAAASPAPFSRMTWQAWLLCGWGVVVLAHLARLICQRNRLVRLLRQSAPAEAALAELAGETAGRLGLWERPQAVVTEADCSPFVCGIRQPVVVVPRRLAASLSASELGQVLLHELAHVRRRDLFWGWIGEAARIIYFYHPVVHWIGYRLRLERELACDQIAMAFSGHCASDYAATLVRVVSHSSEPSVFKTAASAGLGGEVP